MLKELFNAFTGSATNTAFSNPASNGINGVPLKATFGKVVSNLFNSINPLNNPLNLATGNGNLGNQIGPQGIPGFGNQAGIQGFGGFGNQAGIQGFGGIGQPISPQALQAFRNAQNDFNDQPQKTIKNQALAPGAVLLDSGSSPVQPPQFSQGFSPVQSLGVGNGFQGFAGQNTFNNNGNFGNQQSNQAGPLSFLTGNGGPGGKLGLLLFPVIGLFSAIKALFGLRKEIQVMKPIKIDRSITTYNKFNDYVAEEYQEGSFGGAGEFEGTGFAENYNEKSSSQGLQDF